MPPRTITPARVLRGVATALVEDRDRRYNVLDTRGGVIRVRSGGTGGRVGDFYITAGLAPSAVIYQQGPGYAQANVVTVGWGDLKGRDTDLAVARVVEAVGRYESQLPTHADLDRRDVEADRGAEFDHVKWRTRMQPKSALGHAERARLMAAFDAGGLSGKVLFPTIGAALSHSATILAAHGLEWDATFNAHLFSRDAGQVTADISRTNPADAFAPVHIDNTNVTIHWHRFRTGRVEVVMMVGMVAE